MATSQPRSATADRLEDILARCDDAGLSLRSADGRHIRVYAEDLPDDLRDLIRSNRTAILMHLSNHPRPDPDPVWFVAKNLDVVAHGLAIVPTMVAVWHGDRPYYRLTPRVYVWLASALDTKWHSLTPYQLQEAAVLAACDQLTALCGYVAAYFRPDQIARAWRRRQDMPSVPKHSTLTTL